MHDVFTLLFDSIIQYKKCYWVGSQKELQERDHSLRTDGHAACNSLNQQTNILPNSLTF